MHSNVTLCRAERTKNCKKGAPAPAAKLRISRATAPSCEREKPPVGFFAKINTRLCWSPSTCRCLAWICLCWVRQNRRRSKVDGREKGRHTQKQFMESIFRISIKPLWPYVIHSVDCSWFDCASLWSSRPPTTENLWFDRRYGSKNEITNSLSKYPFDYFDSNSFLQNSILFTPLSIWDLLLISKSYPIRLFLAPILFATAEYTKTFWRQVTTL